MEVSDPRRNFSRILLVGYPGLKELLGAKVQWKNTQRTDIVDMSYSGMAVVKPSGLEFTKDKTLKVHVILSESKLEEMEIKFVRETETLWGVQFVNLAPEHIEALDVFLSDKFLGKNIREVNPKFFHSKHHFNHWLHGPNNTNLYFWLNGNKITKAVFEFAELGLVYEGDFRLQNLTFEPEEENYVVFPITISGPKVGMDMKSFMKRGLKVLSQIEKPPDCVWTFLSLMNQKFEELK